jgi:hypothetical protein
LTDTLENKYIHSMIPIDIIQAKHTKISGWELATRFGRIFPN